MNYRIVKLSIISVALASLLLVMPGSSWPSAAGTPMPSAADGVGLFNSKCAICHGKDGKGLPTWRAKGQRDFTDANFQKSKTDNQVADTIRNGKGKFMPRFKEKLSDKEISSLVSQVRSFGKKK
jgi:cytochrome c6